MLRSFARHLRPRSSTVCINRQFVRGIFGPGKEYKRFGSNNQNDEYGNHQYEGPQSSKRNIWKYAAIGGGITVGGYVLMHLDQAPITLRRRVIFMSREQEEQLGRSELNNIMSRAQTFPSLDPATQLVARVGTRIAKASSMVDYNWTFHVVQNEQRNAFVLPGGHVVVYSGLLRLFPREQELAVILGHEIAHVKMRHGAEKLAWSHILLGAVFLANLVIPNSSFFTSRITLWLGSLPYSRKLESEADYVGLLMMAKAGYDPSHAVYVHKKLHESGATIEFFSTHPSSDRRVQQMQKNIPEAQKVYEETMDRIRSRGTFH